MEEDLCPIFDSFFRDVDQVKLGILSHLASFLKPLQLRIRQTYLDTLTALFSSEDVGNDISPLTFGLSV